MSEDKEALDAFCAPLRKMWGKNALQKYICPKKAKVIDLVNEPFKAGKPKRPTIPNGSRRLPVEEYRKVAQSSPSYTHQIRFQKTGSSLR